MNLREHIASRDDYISKMEKAEQAVGSLGAAIVERLKPEAGANLFMYYQMFVVQRLNELRQIGERLYNNRIELLKNDLINRLMDDDDEGTPSWFEGETRVIKREISKEQKEIIKNGKEIDDKIVLDFQSLLLFTTIALDDWSRLAACILGVKRPDECDFVRLIKNEDKGALAEIWEKHKQSIVWMDAFPRLYRNQIITHRSKPWQTSHSRSLQLLNWNFGMMTASDWLDEEQTKQELNKLKELAALKDIKVSANIYQIIAELLRECANFTKEERKGLFDIAKEIGYETPSFQEYCHKLADFMYEVSQSLMEKIISNPEKIILGNPAKRRLSLTGNAK